MTKEEIIRLIHESVKDHSEYYEGCPDPKGEDLEVFVRFAELVAQQAIAEALVSSSHAVAEEREACAKECEVMRISTFPEIMEPRERDSHECADAIRSRK